MLSSLQCMRYFMNGVLLFFLVPQSFDMEVNLPNVNAVYIATGDLISLHDGIRDKILAACTAIKLLPVPKQKIFLPAQSKPRDIFLPMFVASLPTVGCCWLPIFVPTHFSGVGTTYSTGFFVQSFFADRYIHCTGLWVVSLQWLSCVEIQIEYFLT